MFKSEDGRGSKVDELRKIYERLRKQYGAYELYNLMEKCLIEVQLDASDKRQAEQLDLERLLLREIKGLAMQLSRFKPADWNKFLDVVIK